MFSNTITLRVRYAETDRMGYVYYGNYATYFEIGRVECLRKLGISYKELEDNGVLLPVLEYTVKFSKPAFYDEEINLSCSIIKLPTAKIEFEYLIKNAAGEILTKAYTALVFVDALTKKPMACPKEILEKLKNYFK